MRAVTADHVLFAECVGALRSDLAPWRELDDEGLGPLTGHLFLDFELPSSLDLGETQILPCRRVSLAGAYGAFVAPVELPPWVGRHNGHFYTIALSAALSFAWGRAITAPRDDYRIGPRGDDVAVEDLAVQYPVLVAGPGAHDTNLSRRSVDRLGETSRRFLNVLGTLTVVQYQRVMQAIRLVQLSYLNRRSDFALSYYLLISAIEAIAQVAVPRRAVAERHLKEAEWRKRAKEDPDFKVLFRAFREERGKSSYLRKRFIRFVLEYCPIEEWEDLPHPRQNLEEWLHELQPESGLKLTRPSPHDILPSQLEGDSVERILGDAYTHRSRFTHEGAQPPHRDPTSSSIFFHSEFVLHPDGNRVTQVLLPTYDLVAYLARRCIEGWAEQQVGKQRTAAHD